MSTGELRIDARTVIFDNTTVASKVRITSSSAATLRAAHPAQPRLVTILHGAPLANLRLLGTLRVEEGGLTVTNCSIEAITDNGQGGTVPSSERALSIIGGHVALQQTILTGHSAGAINVRKALLSLIACKIRSCKAEYGGAILVGHGAHVDILLSLFADNSAVLSGGALQAAKFRMHFSSHFSSFSARQSLPQTSPSNVLRCWFY
eukprot:7391969-Prymnesium_polylepis.2